MSLLITGAACTAVLVVWITWAGYSLCKELRKDLSFGQFMKLCVSRKPR